MCLINIQDVEIIKEKQYNFVDVWVNYNTFATRNEKIVCYCTRKNILEKQHN